MPELSQKIIDDLKASMKAKDSMRTSCLRMLKSALKNKQIEKGDPLKDEEIQTVISSLIRKGQEAVIIRGILLQHRPLFLQHEFVFSLGVFESL